MSLLETLHRKLEKHGIIAQCIKYLPVISFLFAFIGAGWIFYLPVQGQYRDTYISENALMPSQAYNFYRESEWNFVRGYRSEVEKLANASHEERTDKLAEWLSQTGFKTTIQEGSDEHLSNLYGILHAPRGDDTEAMLLVAPWFTSTGEFNVGGVSLGIALARFLQRVSVWAKNIIVVFPENQSSLRHWVKGYHESFDHTGGSIEGAIVIEYPSSLDYLKYVEVDYVGVNGQLPNLDLINSAVMISKHEGFDTTLHGMPIDVPRNYIYRLKTLWRSIFYLATAGLRRATQNPAEAFSGWNIQAITIRGMEFCNEGSDITSFGRIVEATFRSINNLLEKWHQSFFFYLMLSPVHFVSIATYLPAAVLLAVSFFLASLSIIFNNDDISFKNIDIALPKVSFLFAAVLVSESVIGLSLTYASDDELILLLTFITSVGLTIILPMAKLPQIKLTANEQSILQALSLFVVAVSLLMVTVVHFSLALLSGIAMIPLTFVRLHKGHVKEHQVRNTVGLIASSPFTAIVILGLLSDGWTSKGLIWSPLGVFQGLASSFDALNCWTWAFVVTCWLTTWSCTLLAANAKVLPTEREKAE